MSSSRNVSVERCNRRAKTWAVARSPSLSTPTEEHVAEGEQRLQRVVRRSRTEHFQNCGKGVIALRVRNTFIDVSPERSPSLDPFLRRRRAASSSPTGVARQEGFHQLRDDDIESPLSPRSEELCDSDASTDVTDRSMFAHDAPLCDISSTAPSSPADGQQMAPIFASPWATGPSAHMVVPITMVLGMPMIAAPQGPRGYESGFDSRMVERPRNAASGSESPILPSSVPVCPPGLPSVGSVGHAGGSCKPCAFLYSVGCEKGTSCLFCHLCGPSVRRRQKKAQRQRKAQVEWAKARGMAAPPKARPGA